MEAGLPYDCRWSRGPWSGIIHAGLASQSPSKLLRWSLFEPRFVDEHKHFLYSRLVGEKSQRLAPLPEISIPYIYAIYMCVCVCVCVFVCISQTDGLLFCTVDQTIYCFSAQLFRFKYLSHAFFFLLSTSSCWFFPDCPTRGVYRSCKQYLCISKERRKERMRKKRET